MRTLPFLALLAGCLLETQPNCATGYSRDEVSGECVPIDNTTKIKPVSCGDPAFTTANFGCEGANVVLLADVSCTTTGATVVDLYDSGTGLHEAHDMVQWAVDPTETWEQLETVLEPTGAYSPNTTTGADCYSLGEPTITMVVRTYGSGGALIDCAVVATDPTGPDTLFDGSHAGLATTSGADELTAEACAVLPKP